MKSLLTADLLLTEMVLVSKKSFLKVTIAIFVQFNMMWPEQVNLIVLR